MSPTFTQHSNTTPQPADNNSVCVIYDGTLEDNGARNWLVSLFTDHGSAYALGSEPTSCADDFLADFRVGMMVKRPRPGVYGTIKDKLAQTKAVLKSTMEDTTSTTKTLDLGEKASKGSEESVNECKHERNEIWHKLRAAESEAK